MNERMEETNNYTNPYERANMEYQQASIQPPKKKNKVPGIVLLVLGAIVLLGGIAVNFVGGNANMLESEEAVDVYYATEPDEYSYAMVQYMTESVAYFEAMENMQFYIVFDSEWNPVVICLHTDELATYQPYIDWLYTDSYENEPEEVEVTGYAQPFDAELAQWVMESFNEIFGEELVDESNYVDWFGEYYLQVGQKNSAYGISNVGIYMILVAAILLVIGFMLIYEKPVEMPAGYENGPIVQQSRVGLGILGAFFGAVLGGLAWTVVGALGYVSGWIGILIVAMSYMGYKMMARKEDKIGLVISIIFSLLIIIPATYLAYGWSYYQAMNESISGYTTLVRALMELPVYLTTYDEWSSFIGDLALGYGFMVVAGIYFLAASFKKK